MIITLTEENYLKAIFHLSQKSEGEVSTNAIAEQIDAKASSVTDMLKKLAEKKIGCEKNWPEKNGQNIGLPYLPCCAILKKKY